MSVSWATFEPIVDAITSAFSVSQIVAILGGAIGAAVVFCILWFGIKKVLKIVMGAINGGKLSSGASGRGRGR